MDKKESADSSGHKRGGRRAAIPTGAERACAPMPGSVGLATVRAMPDSVKGMRGDVVGCELRIVGRRKAGRASSWDGLSHNPQLTTYNASAKKPATCARTGR